MQSVVYLDKLAELDSESVQNTLLLDRKSGFLQRLLRTTLDLVSRIMLVQKFSTKPTETDALAVVTGPDTSIAGILTIGIIIWTICV